MNKKHLILKNIGKNKWAMFGPNGNQIGSKFHGNVHKALIWAKIWVSSFNGWTIELEENPINQETDDEKKERVP